MKTIKSFLFLVLFVAVVAGATQVAYNRGLINSHQLENAPFGKLFLSMQDNFQLPEINLPIAGNISNLLGSKSAANENQDAEQVEGDDSSQEMITSAQEQGSTFLTRSQEMIGHVQKVLGDYVEVNEAEQKKSLGEKTLEYTRYQYCKQVIEEYENQAGDKETAQAPQESQSPAE